jgi:hypothetical protein
MLEEALGELIRIKEKYKMLHELSKVFEAIEQVEKTLFAIEEVK